MKRFWTIFAVALVALGVTACSEGADEYTAPATEGVSFYASVNMGADSRATLEKDDEGVWNTIWEGDETLAVTADGSKFYSFTNSVAEPNKFTCTEEDAESLIGQPVNIVNPNAKDNVNSAKGADGINFWAQTTFGSGATVSLETYQCAMLRYSSDYEVTFTSANASDKGMFSDGVMDNSIKEITLPAGEEVFVPVLLGTYTLSYSIGGVTGGTMSISTKEGKLYNLGTLEPKVEDKTIYLVPRMWDQAGASFVVAYGDESVAMTPVADKWGVYEATVPGDATITFKRMSDNGTTVWNNTSALSLPTDDKLYYYITDWSKGEWRVWTEFAWALSGDFNEWGDLALNKESESVYSAKNITMAAYSLFKVKELTSWDISFGANVINYINPNHWVSVKSGGSNMSVTEAGTYDVYFDLANQRCYVVSAGTDYTSVAQQTENGEAPKIEKTTIYFKAGVWDQAGAVFRAWVWGGTVSDKWVYPTKNTDTGYYEFPYDGYTNIIILRAQGGSSGWDNEWNRIETTIPTDDKDCLTMTDWSSYTWSVYAN